MPRVMKGGPSGMRQDYLPPQPPIQDQPVSRDGPVYKSPPTEDFDGATSGMREDYRPPEVGFQRQPVQDTSNSSGGLDPGVRLCSNYSKSTHKPWNAATPDFLPQGGTPDDGAI